MYEHFSFLLRVLYPLLDSVYDIAFLFSIASYCNDLFKNKHQTLCTKAWATSIQIATFCDVEMVVDDLLHVFIWARFIEQE